MICKNCGNDNSSDVTVCVRCGKPLDIEQNEKVSAVKGVAQPSVSATKIRREYIICKKCNAQNYDNYLNCRLCGAKLQNAPQSKMSKKKMLITAAAVLMVAVIAFCTVFFFVIPRSEIQAELVEKTFGTDTNNTFLTTVSQYVDIEVKGYSPGKKVVVEVTSGDISEKFSQSTGYASDSVIDELLKSAKTTSKEITLYFDENGNIALTYEYYNAAYCGLIDAYYGIINDVSEEIVK